MEPLATVVVLTRDRPAELERCLASLSAQVVSVPYEIVVADDGSGPATRAVVERAAARDGRVRHVRHAHRGIPATRNLGVAAARGRFVAIVADDYVLDPRYLRIALDYLAAHPEAAVVRFDLQPLDDSFGSRVSHCYYAASIAKRLTLELRGAPPPRSVAALIRFHLLEPPVVVPAEGIATRTLEASCAAVFRRETLARVGPWDERLPRAEDTEHTARLRAVGLEVHFLPAGTVRHAYRRVPLDTLRKCYLTGIHRARLDLPPEHGRLRAKASGLANALWRARHARTPGATIAYLPWLLLFEGAVVAGSLRGRGARAARRRRARSAGERGEPAARRDGA